MVLAWDVAVNGVRNSREGSGPGAKRHPVLLALLIILLLETAGLAAAVVFLVFEILVATPASFASAVAITVVIAIGAVWLGFIAVGVLRGQAWTRAATVVVQVLFAAVAIGSFQGSDPRPDLGVALLAPAIIAVVLVFSKPVLAATTGRDTEQRTF